MSELTKAVTSKGLVFMQDELVNIYDIEGTILGYIEIERFSFAPMLVREMYVKMYNQEVEYTNEDILAICSAVGNTHAPQQVLNEGYRWDHRSEPHITYTFPKFRVEFYKLMGES
jgi:hypothetical protein